MGKCLTIIVAKGSKISRTWLYRHAKLLISVHAPTGFLTILALRLYLQRTTLLLMVDNLTSLIASIAESARYLSTRDNHVVGVMSRCESNESRTASRR